MEKIIYFDQNKGIALKKEARDSFLSLLGYKGDPGLVFVWDCPISIVNPNIQKQYLMTECEIPINITEIVDERSLLEEPLETDLREDFFFDAEEDEEEFPDIKRSVNKQKKVYDSKEAETSISKKKVVSIRKKKAASICRKKVVSIRKKKAATDDKVTIIPLGSQDSEEIISLYKREHCPENKGCLGFHFFIIQGYCMIKEKKHYGWHIFPENGKIDIMPRFNKVFNKVILLKNMRKKND